jgi:hypothetical protein
MATARALTLIEVVAGLALLVAIMAALLLAKSHWLAANSAADELLSAWLQNPKAFPIQSGGAVPEHADMRWETSLVSNTGVERLGTRVVRLEILPTDHAAAPLCRVELVLPNPDDFHD